MSKYNNRKYTFEGVTFDSKMEFKFYKKLLMTYNKDDITLQPKFELQSKFTNNKGENIRSITYKADFKVSNIVYDVKGFSTPDFKIKAKMFENKFTNLILELVTENPIKYGGGWVSPKQLLKSRTKNKTKIYCYTLSKQNNNK